MMTAAARPIAFQLSATDHTRATAHAAGSITTLVPDPARSMCYENTYRTVNSSQTTDPTHR